MNSAPYFCQYLIYDLSRGSNMANLPIRGHIHQLVTVALYAIYDMELRNVKNLAFIQFWYCQIFLQKKDIFVIRQYIINFNHFSCTIHFYAAL